MEYITRRRSGKTNSRARHLRRGDNMAEALLWDELKARKLGGYKFVRQMPLGPYFADFACRSTKLVVELDGFQHAEQDDYDRQRDAFMCRVGYSVLRFWSYEVMRERRNICETILAALDGRLAINVISSNLRFTFSQQTNLFPR